MKKDMKLIEILFLQQMRLNILMPLIHLILKNRMQEIIMNDDNDKADNRIKLFNQIQNEILTVTSNNERLKKFPISLNYRQLYLKKLINLFEQVFDSDCILEDIYTIYADLINVKYQVLDINILNDNDLLIDLSKLFEQDNNTGIITYVFDTFQLSIIETNSIVKFATTGLRTWPAALHLLDYFLNLNCHNFDDNIEWNRSPKQWTNIIELGSGSGLLGIGIIKSGFFNNKQNAHYIFTDHNENVLKNIELNLYLNNIEMNNNNENNVKICIQKYDWNDYDEFDFEPSSICDLIVASDIIYDPSLIDIFIQTLIKMFTIYRNADSSKRPPDCIICLSKRNAKLYDLFQQKLSDSNLLFKQLDILLYPKWFNQINNFIDDYFHDNVVIDENFNQLFRLHDDFVETILLQISIK